MVEATNSIGGPSASPGGPPPAEWIALNDIVYGMFRAQMVCAAAELGIADQLAGGPRSISELAGAIGAHEASLRRVMRALVSVNIFEQDDAGKYALTPISQLLRSDVPRSLRPMARFYGLRPVWNAWGDLGHSLRTGEDAFTHTHGSPHFSYMNDHPDEGAIFNDFMSSLPLFVGAMLYDFSAVDVVIDIGGGQGNGLIPLLKKYPELRGVLVELPAVAAGARAAINGAGLGERCEILELSFFDAAPPGGDVYLLSNILHDWDDARCDIILGNIRTAIPANGTLLIVEGVVPPGSGPSPLKMLDIQMLVLLGGIQRTEDEFRDLLSRNGFALEKIVVGGISNLLIATPLEQ